MTVPRSRQKLPPQFTKFSAQGTAELRDVLGTAARKLTPQLNQLARTCVRAAKLKRDQQTGAQSLDRLRGSVERRKLIAALRVLVKRLDDFMPFANSGPALFETVALVQVARDEATRVRELRKAAHEGLRRMEERQRSMTSRRGRPADLDRKWLVSAVAIVLRLGGIPVKASREGSFARVLETVLAEVYGSAPDDQFRVIQETASLVNAPSLAELRDHVRETAKYTSDESFWLKLAR